MLKMGRGLHQMLKVRRGLNHILKVRRGLNDVLKVKSWLNHFKYGEVQSDVKFLKITHSIFF